MPRTATGGAGRGGFPAAAGGTTTSVGTMGAGGGGGSPLGGTSGIGNTGGQSSGADGAGGACLLLPGQLNCGSDCTPCTRPANGTNICENGRCSFSCKAGYHRCDQVCASDTDVATCGTACSPCAVPAHATVACVQGACVTSCGKDYVACSDGTCAPLAFGFESGTVEGVTLVPENSLAVTGTLAAPQGMAATGTHALAASLPPHRLIGAHTSQGGARRIAVTGPELDGRAHVRGVRFRTAKGGLP